jgi:hypothetical protein
MPRLAATPAMRMLDADREQSIRVLQLYLTPKEATDLLNGLTDLLKKPEANEHVHVFAHDMSRELSFSIVTEKKLKDSGYTELERRVFAEK